MRSISLISIPLFIVTVLTMASCNSATETSTTYPNTEIQTVPPQTFISPSPLIQVRLFMSEAPPLSVPTDLNCTVKLISRYSGVETTTAQIILPDNVTLVSGNLTWSGDIDPGESVSFSNVIIFNEIGHFTIKAVAGHQIDKQHGWGDADFLYLDIGVEQSQFGWEPEMPQVTIADESSFPKVELSISHPPKLNESAVVTCVLTVEKEFPGITATILLSLGAEFISGDLEWQGDLEAGVPVSFSAQIRFKQTGYSFIGWRVRQAGNDISWANPRNIQFQVGEGSGSFLDLTLLPPPAP